jgi:hypothetical protein
VSAEILNFRDLGLTLEQFAQFTDAEIVALSNTRMAAIDAARIAAIKEDEPLTPEEQAEADALWTEETSAREKREAEEQTALEIIESVPSYAEAQANRLALREAQATAEAYCRLAGRGAQGEAYIAILRALMANREANVAEIAAMPFKYPKVHGTEFDFVIGAKDVNTEGWFPRGDVHLIGGPSGSNKTTFMIDVLETQLKSETFLGHETYGLPYLVLMSDRGSFAHLRTAHRMHFDPEQIPIKFLPSVTGRDAITAIRREIENAKELPAIVFIEGCDLLTENASKMEIVTPFLDGLQKIAQHYHISIIGSVGSPKTRKGEGYISKRDGIFGTITWSRKTETIAVLQYPDGDDMDSRRVLSVLLRNGPAEKYSMKLANGRLVATTEQAQEPAAQPQMEWLRVQTDWFTSQDLQEGIKVSGATADRYIASAHAKGVLIMKRGPKGSAKLYKWNPTAVKDTASGAAPETGAAKPDLDF